jgi:hypothetical protein
MGRTRWVVLFVLIGLFVVYVLASVWERFNSNDYCNSGYAAAYGPLLGRWYYDRVTGTLTANTLYGILAQHQNGPTGLLTAFVLAAWLAMTWRTLRQIALFRGRASLIALFIVIAVLDIVPAIGQDFYWETGLFEYGFTLLLLTVTFWWITRPDRPQMRLVNLIGTGVTALLTAACSNLGAVLFPALFAGLWLAFPRDARAFRRNLLAALLCAGVGAVIVVDAPASAIHAATLPPRNFPASVLAGVAYAGQPIVEAVTRSPAAVIAFAALIILIGAIVRADYRMGGPERSHTALIILSIILGSCVLSEFVFFFTASSTDFANFGRSELFPLCVIVVGLALLSIVIRRPVWMQSPVIVGGMFAVFALASLLRAGTLIETMATYAQQWDARDAAIRNGVTSVAALHIFERSDIETDWVLACVRQYYGAAVQPMSNQ